MKKDLIAPIQPGTPSELASLPCCRTTSDAATSDSEASENNAMMCDFAEDLQSLLESIASLCGALHTPELDHWTSSQRKVIDALEKAMHEAAMLVDQVCVEFTVTNRAQDGRPPCNDKTTH